MGRENETDGWLKIFEIVMGNGPCYTTCKMNTPDVHPYLERARHELHAVEVNIREQLYAVAISRSYYAMFYAASGLLARACMQTLSKCHCERFLRSAYMRRNLPLWAKRWGCFVAKNAPRNDIYQFAYTP